MSSFAPPHPISEATSGTLAHGSPYRILVVDDTRAIHDDFRKILLPVAASDLDAQEAELFGEPTEEKSEVRFELESAYQGKEALETVQKASGEGRPFALVFMDIRMPPGWDGIETTERVWVVDPDMQIVVCTAYSDYSWDQMTARFGLTDNLVILKKPFDTMEVLQLAHALTHKWRLTQESKRNVEHLNELVRLRTAELVKANENLLVDITRRQRAEDALRKAQQRLSHLISRCPAVIYSFDTDEKSITPTWVSNNITELLGFSAEEACAPDWWAAHVHPDDYDHALLSRAELFRTTKAAAEYRLQHKLGEYRWVRDEQRLIRGEAGAQGEIVGTWMDVTTRKELEAQLRHSQKMEAIGMLAGGVAHDFNNLLAVIRLNSEMALMTGGGQLNQQTSHCMEQITAAVDRASNLTRQLLAFGRKQVMQSKPVNLNDLIANLTKMLVRIIGEHIKFECRYAERLPLVQADSGMIEQVLTNLVINARDAMPNSGELLVQTDETRVAQPGPTSPAEARAGRFVRLTVTDSGSGISPEDLPRIFEPFFSTKSAGKGTGLGLATAYGIVKQHGGWIEVASKVDHGSSFRIYLPAMETSDPPAAQKAPAATRPRGGTETILLVEDEEAVRTLTRRLLNSFGYKVYEADCGKSALNSWQSRLEEVDLLLTDMIMPNGVNGRQLIEQMQRVKPGLKTIIMSGYSGDSLVHDSNFIRQTRSRFIQKPCAWRELVQTVRDYLDER